MREDAIIAVLGPEPQSARTLMEQLYSEINPALKRSAERNVIAHLLKLAEEGKARDAGPGWVAGANPRTPAGAG
jgi:hypothetical protein